MPRKAGWKWSEEVKQKMRDSWTPERKKKFSLARKKLFKTGKMVPPFTGRTQTAFQRKRVSETMKGVAKTPQQRQKLKDSWNLYTEQERYQRTGPAIVARCKKIAENNPVEILTESVLKKLHIDFKSQELFHKYVVDFYIPKLHVAIECDGRGHTEAKQIKRDKARDEFLQKRFGLRVIHISNEDLKRDAHGVIKSLLCEKI